ncbi:hypothetical protein OG21DRAFT_1490955 [Imleria badia]|nr:hypothetical protein OG21DRAFT_1490955 [Imleria badia]
MTNDPSQPILAGLPPAPAATRTNQNRCHPVQYCDSAGNSEFINIDVIKESSGDNDIVDDGTQAQHTGLFPTRTLPAARTTPNAGVSTTSVVTPAPAARTTPNLGRNTMADPLETGRNAPPTSVDICHFFTKVKLKDTVCRVCADGADTNSQLHNYSFSCNMSNHSLRCHIISWHLKEYLELAEMNDWPVQIDAVRIVRSTGYSLRAIREAIWQGHKLTALPELLCSNSGDSQPCNFLPSDNTPAIPEFSLTALQEYLVKFIVADDQVHIA